MIYTAHITYTSGGSADDPVRTKLQITKGLIYRVEIQFPPGCAGLVHTQIFDGVLQLWPSTIDDSFAADSTVIGFDDSYFKLTAPYFLDILGYNLDDTYDHTIGYRIGLVSKDLFIARFVPSVGYQQLQRVIAEEQANQEQARKQALINPFPEVSQSTPSEET